jgi:membrane peptidoglycan carboxypeptidase
MASRTLRRRVAYRALNDHARTGPRAILRILLVVLVALTMLTSGASAATILFYGENLPTLAKFKSDTQFQNTVFLDRYGHVMYDMADLSRKGGAERVVEPLRATGHSTKYFQSQHEDWLVGDDPCTRKPCDALGFQRQGIPMALQQATIATEDATFYSNPGFDPLSIARAGFDDVTTGHIVSGASTITQQLVKQYIVGEKQTLSRKAEEIILAAEMTQKYPKSKILWYYLNGVSYGNFATGAQAAARTYFHTDVWNLDPAQCALLAGLPEAPSNYDPVNNRPAALARMHYVLHLMYVHGYLKTNGKPDASLVNSYMREAEHWPQFQPPQTKNPYPHFIEYALNQLEHNPDVSQRLYGGLIVKTTLDPNMQQEAQAIVKQQVQLANVYNVSDGALVSMDLQNDCYGCIRAMVGSANYYDKAISGQINMADRPRQPGSSFKPFNYIYAFEHGLGPGTTVLDGPISIPDPGNPEDGGYYSPTDYDHTFHGVVTLRVALQNSLNVPAVRVEQYGATCGTCGPNGLWNIANQAMKQGITSLKSDNPNCCGWALTLGGMDQGVRLVEETSAYGAFGTGGNLVPPQAIEQVRDRTTGKLLWDVQQATQKKQQVIPPEYAYIMNNVLSDNASRCTPQVCEFGLDSPLNIGRPAAAKTGTTNLFTDNWTVGYTPQLVTGVWVGNANNAAMYGSTGITGAAPIWNEFMRYAVDYLHLPPVGFVEPPGVYSSSLCRIPDAYGSPSTGVFDIWAGVEPYCSVGSTTSSLPVAPAPSYQGPSVLQPSPAPAPTTAPLVPAPAATVPPVVQPTTPPVAQQPTVVPLAPQPTAPTTGQGRRQPTAQRRR